MKFREISKASQYHKNTIYLALVYGTANFTFQIYKFKK